MSLDHVDFTGAIRAAAASLGRIPTADQVTALDQVLKSNATHDTEAGAVTVDGKPVGEFLEHAASAFPMAAGVATEAPLDPARWVKSPVGTSTGWRRADDPFHQINEAFAEHHAAGMRRELATWPNPWAEGRENRTRQQIIQKFNPTLAAQFKRQSGAV